MSDINFLGHGSINVISVDIEKQQTILNIVIPYSLLFQLTPVLLQSGSLRDLKVYDPLVVWQPNISEFIKDGSGFQTINDDLKSHIEDYVIYLTNICHILKNPDIIGTALPTGVYVSVNYTSSINGILNSIVEIQKMLNISGMTEFQLALSASLSEIVKITNEHV